MFLQGQDDTVGNNGNQHPVLEGFPLDDLLCGPANDVVLSQDEQRLRFTVSSAFETESGCHFSQHLAEATMLSDIGLNLVFGRTSASTQVGTLVGHFARDISNHYFRAGTRFPPTRIKFYI
ncbi:hypothetical protein RvY_07284 [Ramazzottius varieornatus]|uniref:Uncharacterized protein n=1 Tax=Ramazzottius varieornatus TaxID=947166 RepID=A0A1D1VB23_RAMVA|nr:hypothetical protein RvY_07284 [Ramazzottius varieornatus]